MKQTPEQAAFDALQIYADGLDATLDDSDAYTAKHEAARQTIIKAFQDRADLLTAVEGLLAVCAKRGIKQGPRLNNARAAITKAKS